MSTPHITLVRQQLLDTLTDLRNREQPMDVDRARAVAQVASVLVDTAKVEVEYLKVTHSDRSDFLEAPPTAPQLPAPSSTPTAHNPFPTSARHTLAG
ncbi:hypothetical protein WKI45_14920 [Delftia tsuruhatensis]|jgi:hypothetical protein